MAHPDSHGNHFVVGAVVDIVAVDAVVDIDAAVDIVVVDAAVEIVAVGYVAVDIVDDDFAVDEIVAAAAAAAAGMDSSRMAAVEADRNFLLFGHYFECQMEDFLVYLQISVSLADSIV